MADRTTATTGASRRSALQSIVLGTVAVGSLDITYAMIFWAFRGARPIRIFQSVAAGLLGRSAFSGGIGSALLGALLHYFISFAIVTVYWLASRRWRGLVRHPIACGALYGLLVYAFMNYVVIPLSATARPRFLLSWVVCSLIAHALLVGVPAALSARSARDWESAADASPAA